MADEKLFKRWLKNSLPETAHATHIETATVSGVPDTHVTFQGITTWVECKDIPTSSVLVKLRAVQYMWFKKHIAAGGRGILAIKRKDKSVDLYSAADIVKVDQDKIKTSGKDYILTGLVEPFYTVFMPLSMMTRKEYWRQLLIRKL